MTETESNKQRSSLAPAQVSRQRFMKNYSLGVGAVAVAGSCSEPAQAAAENSSGDGEQSAHFHHVHLNVTDPRRTSRFYQYMFVLNRYVSVALPMGCSPGVHSF